MATKWSALSTVELDNLVVASLTDSLRTEVTTEQARILGRQCANELTSLLVFAPRLWDFSHRHSLSLRHPRMSYTSWAHRIEGGAPREPYDVLEVILPSTSLLDDDATPEALKWGEVASVYGAIMDNTPELEEARRRILDSPSVQDAILRIWSKMVDPMLFPTRPTSGCAWYEQRGSMTPRQYMYVQLRLVQTLLPDAPLASTDLLDIMERDMMIDMHRPERCLEDASSSPYFDSNSLLELAHTLQGGNTEASLHHTISRGDMYDLRFQEHTWNPTTQVRDYRALPNISFPAFVMSMVELSDNWTSTSTTEEHAAFLFDLLDRMFTQDWAAQADAMMIRAAIKQKTPGVVPAMFPVGPTQTTASIAERRMYRKESTVQAQSLAAIADQGSAVTGMTMGQVMMLPNEVRDSLLDGTHEALLSDDDIKAHFAEVQAGNARNRSPTVRELRLARQIMIARRNHRPAIPQMLFTLTAEPTIKAAMKEARHFEGNLSNTARRRPNVHLDKRM